MYSLKVFVKHEGLTQRGEGSCATIPIRILPLPIQLDRQDIQVDVTGFDITVRQSQEESKDDIVLRQSELEMEFGRESESNFVIDDLSRKYY